MMKPTPSILITGGAGSFGRACASFLLRQNMVERLCIFSRGEHTQAQMRAELKNDDRLRFFVGDVRDVDRLVRAMAGVDLVIHAAALKRIEVGHYNPDEMVKTNVLGAMNVIEAARRAHVARVVALSTDKAFQPISAYGQSKAMMESLFLAANDTSGAGGPSFRVTRYGNVWGSAGSVVPTWIDLVDRGAPKLPVTNPLCTRFFMTMLEAVELVINTAADPNPKGIAMKTLPAYRLGDLADAFGMPMQILGLPRHEKLHEGMDSTMLSDQARRMTIPELQFWIGKYRENDV